MPLSRSLHTVIAASGSSRAGCSGTRCWSLRLR